MKLFTVHVLDHGLNFMIDPAGPVVLGVWQGDPLPAAVVVHRLAVSPTGLDFEGETLTLDAFGLLKLVAWVDQRSGLTQARAKRRRLQEMLTADIWSTAMLEAFDRLDAHQPAPAGECSYVQSQAVEQLVAAYEAIMTGPAGAMLAARHRAD